MCDCPFFLAATAAVGKVDRPLGVNCRRSCELGKALNGRQDSKLRPLPSELLNVGDHEVSPVVNDSVGNCAGNCSLAGNQKPVGSTSWLHRSIPSRPITFTLEQRVSNRPAQAAGVRNNHVAAHYRRVIQAPRRIAKKLDGAIVAPRA